MTFKANSHFAVVIVPAANRMKARLDAIKFNVDAPDFMPSYMKPHEEDRSEPDYGLTDNNEGIVPDKKAFATLLNEVFNFFLLENTKIENI